MVLSAGGMGMVGALVGSGALATAAGVGGNGCTRRLVGSEGALSYFGAGVGGVGTDSAGMTLGIGWLAVLGAVGVVGVFGSLATTGGVGFEIAGVLGALTA